MSEFKGSKGKLERKYVSSICIGIGTIGDYSKMVANSILDHIDTDEDYAVEKEEIEANMLLYSKAPEMLEMLKSCVKAFEQLGMKEPIGVTELIKEATEL